MNATEGCYQNKADAMSLSLESSSSSDIARDFFEDLFEDFFKNFFKGICNNNVVIVAEAGDNSNSNETCPASYLIAISVGVLDLNKERVSFSQHNNQAELSVPGKAICSTCKDNGYATMDGTSMAIAHAAAAAGLLRMCYSECFKSEIHNVIAKTALDIDSYSCDENTGCSLIQAKDVHELLLDGDCEGDLGLVELEGSYFQLHNCHSNNDPCTNDMCFNGFC